MTNEFTNSIISTHSDTAHFCRSICSRRLYYQRLRLKRIIAHYQHMQCLPLEHELEVSDVG
jgi:hypothetical protein